MPCFPFAPLSAAAPAKSLMASPGTASSMQEAGAGWKSRTWGRVIVLELAGILDQDDAVTANGRQRGGHCEPAAGLHVEAWDGVGQMAVPDRAVVVRRHFVRD